MQQLCSHYVMLDNMEIALFVCQDQSNIDNFITFNLKFPIWTVSFSLLSLSLSVSPHFLILPWAVFLQTYIIKLRVSINRYICLLDYSILKCVFLGSFSHYISPLYCPCLKPFRSQRLCMLLCMFDSLIILSMKPQEKEKVVIILQTIQADV